MSDWRCWRPGFALCSVLVLGSFAVCDAFAGKAAFDFAPSPAVGSQPHAIAVAKLHAGSSTDIVVSNTSGATNSVLLGNGDGIFQTQVAYTTGQYPYAVLIDDFNNDGTPDIVAVNRGGFPTGSVSLLIGNGDGTFQPQQTFNVGYSPRGAASGDFGNGHIDLAVTNSPDATVSVLLNNGSGVFATQVVYPTDGNHPEGIVATRLQTSGNLDLVVAAGSVVSVLRGNGNGTFQPAVSYPALGTTALAIADFNGDGAPDVVVANGSSNSISVFLGNGDGTLKPRVDYTSGSGTFALVVGDFDADGHKDVVAVDSGSPNLMWLFSGNGNGTLNSGVVAAILPGSSGSIATGNFRGTAQGDVAVVNAAGSVSILLNRTLIFADAFDLPAGDCPPGTIRLGDGSCGIP